MDKTLELLKFSERCSLYVCKDTGEESTLSEWAQAIAEKTGKNKNSVRGVLYQAIRDGRKAYGLTFAKKE
jgi:hypothetical protein